jgi:hypothetical protein
MTEDKKNKPFAGIKGLLADKKAEWLGDAEAVIADKKAGIIDGVKGLLPGSTDVEAVVESVDEAVVEGGDEAVDAAVDEGIVGVAVGAVAGTAAAGAGTRAVTAGETVMSKKAVAAKKVGAAKKAPADKKVAVGGTRAGAVDKGGVAAAAGPTSLKLALFGGAGIGLLFGVIMGTSTTPTVATVLGALTTMLAGILGMNDKYFGNAKAVRIGAFGFSCVLGAYLGLFVRSHNLLSPTLVSLKKQYVELGFSEAQALDFIAQKEFGVSLAALTGQQPVAAVNTAPIAEGETVVVGTTVIAAAVSPVVPSIAAQIHQQHSSLLFSSPVDLSSCDELEGTDDTLPLDEVINNFELTGDMWETASLLATEQLTPAQQKGVMLATKDAICSSGKIDDGACEQMKALAQQLERSDYPSLVAQFNRLDQSWQSLSLSVDQQTLSEADKQQALFLIINTLCE